MASYEETPSTSVGLSSSRTRGLGRTLLGDLGLKTTLARSVGVGRNFVATLGLKLTIARRITLAKTITTSAGLSCSLHWSPREEVLSTSIGSSPFLHWSPREEGLIASIGLESAVTRTLSLAKVPTATIGLVTIVSRDTTINAAFEASIGPSPLLHWSPREESLAASVGLICAGSRLEEISRTLQTTLGLLADKSFYRPKGFAPRLEHFDGAWLEDTELVRFSISGSIARRVRVLEAEVTNPSHSKDDVYQLYRTVRLVDAATTEVLLHGRIESVEPMGDTMRIMVHDGLSELAQRRVDTLTGGPFTRRSAMISALISQNSYGSNIELGGIENSAITGSFDRTYAKGDEGGTVLSEIQRIASEDPWDGGPSGYGYDFHLSWVSQAIPQRFDYFKRGSRPAAPVADNGLTLKLGGVHGDQERPIYPGYYFTKEGAGITSCVRVRYFQPDDEDHPRYGGTWSYVEAVDTSLESTIARRKMRIFSRPDISTQAAAQDFADAVLHRLGRSNIQRGHLTFAGYPVIKLGTHSYSLVRAGHLIHVTGLDDLPALNDRDMLLTSFKYSWPEHTAECEVITDLEAGFEYAAYDPEEYMTNLQERLDKFFELNSTAKCAVTYVIDGGGSAIGTGEKGHLVLPFNCGIVAVELESDQTGSIKIDIWRDSYANFPPDNVDSLCGGSEPEISSGRKYFDNVLSGWAILLLEGDILAYNVDSCSGIQRVTVSLFVLKLG